MGLRALVDVVVPPVCPACGRQGTAPCPECWSGLQPAPPAPPPPGLDQWAALLSYDGSGRELLARLKYRNNRSAVAWLAAGMAALVEPSSIDVVTWAPTSAARRRHRGFDQAEVLAQAVARRLRRPARPLLARQPGPPQTGRSLVERRDGPVFRARHAVPARVLIVDDVATSGATLAAAAAALRAAGALRVAGLTAGRTPPPAR